MGRQGLGRMRLYFNVGLLALVVAVTVTFISTPDITLASEPEEPPARGILREDSDNPERNGQANP